jgi:hypothetical protein
MQGVFIVALIPTMLHADKKPTLSTSLLITGGVATISVVYFTLFLWVSAIVTALHAMQWAVVAYQRWKLDRTS